jgi:hypothetical protein
MRMGTMRPFASTFGMRSNVHRAQCLVLMLAVGPALGWSSDDVAERQARRRELREHLQVERERWHSERGAGPRMGRAGAEGAVDGLPPPSSRVRPTRPAADDSTDRAGGGASEAATAAPRMDFASRPRAPGMRLSADERRDLRHSLRERPAEGRGPEPGSEPASR